MTADVAVVTAIYDGYDVLKPVVPQMEVEVDWVCVTDGTAWPDNGWRRLHEPRPGLHPNRAAKIPKLRPWEYTDAPVSIWIDAAVRVVSDRFAADMADYVDLADEDSRIAQFIHPWRDCLYDEATASMQLAKYAGEPVLAQAEHYRMCERMPEHWGLWATTVIVRRHTPDVWTFANLWAEEIEAWSFQDQISQPYALYRSGLRPVSLPGTHLESAWTKWEGSVRH